MLRDRVGDSSRVFTSFQLMEFNIKHVNLRKFIQNEVP